MKICYGQGYNDIGVVITMTYFSCSSISRHWGLFFQNRSREPFPPIAASVFVKFFCKGVIEIFWDKVFMVRNTVKKWTILMFGCFL